MYYSSDEAPSSVISPNLRKSLFDSIVTDMMMSIANWLQQ